MDEFKKQFKIVKDKYIEDNGSIDKKTYQRLYNRTRRQYDADFKLQKQTIFINYTSNNKETVAKYMNKYRAEHLDEYNNYQKDYQNYYYYNIIKPRKDALREQRSL